MELTVSLEVICRLIVRARELEAQVTPAAEEDQEEPLDADDELAPLDPDTNDAVEEEIEQLLDDLAEDQIAEILALAWVGRGTYDASEWDEALEAANEEPEPVDELLEMPMLAGYLDAGLAAFDLSCTGVGQID